MLQVFSAIRALTIPSRHVCCATLILQSADRASPRSFSFWSPWRSATRIQADVQTPKKPVERFAHGSRWTDDYSWMESSDLELDSHLEAEQHYALEHCIEMQDQINRLAREITAKLGPYTATHAEQWGAYSYYTEQTAQRPHVAYMRKDAQGLVEPVLDINEIQSSADLIHIGQVKVSPNQQLVAYTQDMTSGGESYAAIVQTIGDKAKMVDQLVDVCSIEWAGNEALVYTQISAQGQPAKAMLHQLGQPQQQDQCLLHEANESCFLELAMTLDGAYVTINSNSKTTSEVYLVPTDKPSTSLTLVQPRIPGLQYFVGHHKGSLLILTNHNSSQDFQIMTAPVSSPEISNWQTVVPERPGVAVTDMDIFATHAVLYERHEGRPGVSLLPLLPQQVDLGFSLEAAARQHHTVSHSACTPKLNTDSNRKPSGPSTCSSECNQEGSIYQASCHTERAAAAIQPAIQPASVGCPTNDYVSTRQLQGHAAACTAQQGDASLQTVHLPKWVMDIQPGGNPDHESGTVRLHLSSPVHPQHVYDCHLDTGCLELLGVQQVARHNADDFVCTLQWARSTDGTEIPMTVAHKKGMKLDGSNPVLVTVYGSYGVCLDAGFQPERLPLLERGWVITLAHVRGGGELGRQWHAAGRTSKKLNSVLDLEACLDMLYSKGYTRKGLIALEGTSAGGLLVGALLNRQPQSFLGAVLRVPFVDFLTTMVRPDLLLTKHEYEEWGDPADPSALQLMIELCPYQNLKSAAYPPILATCSEADVRVPAWGPAKWIAKLRAHQKGSAPIMLMSNSDSGHFGHEAEMLDNAALECALLLRWAHAVTPRKSAEV